MIPNWNISTPSKGLSSLSGSEGERSVEKKMALLNSAMPYSLIQTEFRNCLSLLSDLYACTWALSQLFQSSEFTSHHTSHRDSSKLSCQSSTTLGKKSIAFLLLYLEQIKVLRGTTCCSNGCSLRIFEGLEHNSTMLPRTATAGDSVLPSPTAGKPPKQRLSEATWIIF